MNRAVRAAKIWKAIVGFSKSKPFLDFGHENDATWTCIRSRHAENEISRAHPGTHGNLARSEVKPAIKFGRDVAEVALLVLARNSAQHVNEPFRHITDLPPLFLEPNS
jgi:hypothetical protein